MSVALDHKGREGARRAPSRSTMSRFAKPQHKRASRMLGYALTLGDGWAWEAASAVWQAGLTPEEGTALAVASLHALPSQAAAEAVRAALGESCAPFPPLEDMLADAAFWADCAAPDTLSVYAVACVNRMPPALRADFRAFLEDAHG